MIYIEENSFERQLLIISEMSSMSSLELVLWLYPESSIDNIIGANVFESVNVSAMPVTTRENGAISRCTQRLQLTEKLISEIAKNKDCIVRNCDSLCIYTPKNAEWQACIIGHEGMVLVRDSALLDELKCLGFNASLHAPSWW